MDRIGRGDGDEVDRKFEQRIRYVRDVEIKWVDGQIYSFERPWDVSTADQSWLICGEPLARS